MDMLEALKLARQVLTEKGWTREFFAYTSIGRSCYGWHPEACKFCALGALHHVLGQDVTVQRTLGAELYYAAVDALMASLPPDSKYHSVPAFNDHAESVDEVLALYDRAIAKLEAV